MAPYTGNLRYGNASYNLELGAFKVLTDWDETLTYNEHINEGKGQYSTYANDSQRGSGVRYDLDITEYVAEWYNDPSTNFGIAVTITEDHHNGMDKLYRFNYGYNGSAMYIEYKKSHLPKRKVAELRMQNRLLAKKGIYQGSSAIYKLIYF